MKEGVKLYVVACDSCGDKQIWDSYKVSKSCYSCDSLLVKKTISDNELRQVKASAESSAIVFSDFEVYSVYPEDVELIRSRNREVKKAAFIKKVDAKKKSREKYGPKLGKTHSRYGRR